jgi:hypothetical protein
MHTGSIRNHALHVPTSIKMTVAPRFTDTGVTPNKTHRQLKKFRDYFNKTFLL